MNNEILKNKYKHTRYTYFEKSYLRGIKELAKKHRKDVLKKLDKIVDELENFDVTTQYDNHVLSDGETYELHVPCKGDVLLTYKYVSGDLFIDLNLLNLVDHKNLSKTLNNSLEEDKSLNKRFIKKQVEEEFKEIQVRDNENIEKDAEECPLPLEVIPNNMGINLSNVEKVAWEEQEDGQLKKIEIDFNPGDDLEEDIEKHDTLNPVLFDNNELKPEIKEAIEKIVNTFVEELKENDINLVLKDVILVGSNVSYNYTKDSDLDIHLIVDSSALDCPKDIVDKLYSAYRSIFNRNYDIKIKGIPAEIYVELDNLGSAKSNGIYSLNTGWIKEPEQRDIPELNKEEFDKAFKPWEDRYNELITNTNTTSEDVVTFINDIYKVRKESIAQDGEYSQGNLIFKELRNKGYLDNLKQLRKEIKGKELSLEHLEEEVVSDEDAFWNIRNSISDVISDKYDEVNLVIDNGEIRPITKEEQANKFAVSVEHANRNDYKSKEEIEKIAKDINAEKIMFFVYKGQYGGEYSFLVNDENVAKEIAKKYDQDSYASYDDNGNYHEIKIDKRQNSSYNKRELEYFKHENLRVRRR